MDIDLQPDERIIDSWTLFYQPPSGGKYNGKLTATNRRLLYDAKLDASAMGVLGNRGATGHLVIDKDDVQDVEVQKRLLSKKVILTLADGSNHIFDRGAMNIDPIVEAIQAR